MKKSVFFSSPWKHCGSNYGAYECSLCITGDQCKCVFLSPLADIREYGEVWKAMVTEEGLCGEYFCVLTKPYSLRLRFRRSGSFCSPLRCDLWHHIHQTLCIWGGFVWPLLPGVVGSSAACLERLQCYKKKHSMKINASQKANRAICVWTAEKKWRRGKINIFRLLSNHSEPSFHKNSINVLFDGPGRSSKQKGLHLSENDYFNMHNWNSCNILWNY